MEIRISLQSRSLRLLTGLSGTLICGILGLIVLSTFITGVLADDRVFARIDQLESYVKYWPDSARIQAKLADARLSEPDRDIPAIESGARAACSLSPFDYRHRLLLATVEEASGDRQAAESTLERARALAPNNAEVIWRQANLLVREGKGAESQEVLRSACASDPALVPIAVDLLWRASNENAAAVESVVPSDPQSRLNLAGFLA